MRVQVISDLSDHRRSYGAGEVCDLPDDQATRWIDQGLAVACSVDDVTLKAEAPTVEVPEAAALDDTDETAMLPRARKR